MRKGSQGSGLRCVDVRAAAPSGGAGFLGLLLRLTAILFFIQQATVFAGVPSAKQEKSSAELVRMGEDAFRAGRYSAAAELYREALKADEGNFTARLKLVELLARLSGREEEAKREIEFALAMESLTPEQIGLIAEVSLANDFPGQARSALERVLATKPNDLSALKKLVGVLLSQGDFQEVGRRIEVFKDSPASTVEGLETIAAECAERSQHGLAEVAYRYILERDANNLRALVGAAECLAKSGRFSEAADKLSRAAESNPEEIGPSLALGELFLRTGDYTRAEEAFEKALGIDPNSSAAADGKARALFSVGRYREARAVLSKSLELQPGSPILLVAMGRVLNYLGEYECSREHFNRALAAKPRCPDATLGLGLSYRETGKLDLAKEEFLKLYDFWDAHIGELDSVHPGDMLDVAIACALTDNPQDAIDVLEHVLKRDPTNPEALLWEARLFAERHQPQDAIRELQKLLSINPNHPEAYAEAAEIYLRSNPALGGESCQRALKTNPNLIRGLEVLCSIQLFDFNYKEAEQTARKALDINPRSLSGLSSLASCYWLMGDKIGYENARTKVFEINPVYSEFYLTVARACENKRRNREAIELLREAVALKPDYAPAYASIGALLMREGEEEEAETYLRKSYQLDSYNPMTTNFINLLEHMKRNFVTTRTEHFLLKWDGEEGAVLGFFLPEHVEKVYGEVCRQFGYEPNNPTLVEIFESHDLFSARIVGLPFIATVGASLGKVVAADLPRQGRGSFDWKDVLRHEFVHVVNLQQSKMQIPFWLTEGLATSYEESPLPAIWDELLSGMSYTGQIIPLKDLNSYFTRPRTPDNKQAAYAQSNLICRYVREKHGPDVLRKMIGMYAENFLTADVIRQCLSMTDSEFEEKIEEYIFSKAREKNVAPLFLVGDGERIAQGLKEKPDDSLLNVAHARWLFQEASPARAGGAGLSPSAREANLDEAVEILGKVTKKCPQARGAFSTLAEIYLARGKYDEAKSAALQAMAVDEKDFAAHHCLGVVYQRMGDRKEAIAELEKAATLYSQAPRVWYALAQLCSQEKDNPGMIRALEGAANADRKNTETSKKLAAIYLSSKDCHKAIEILERALRHDLYDPVIYKLMAEAFGESGDEKSAKKYAEIGAEAAYASAKSLMPFNREKVVELLTIALELNPQHQKSRDLLSRISPAEGGVGERSGEDGSSANQKPLKFGEFSDILAANAAGCAERAVLEAFPSQGFELRLYRAVMVPILL